MFHCCPVFVPWIQLQLRAGVPLACVTITYNLLDVSTAPILQLCRKHDIKVFASGALAHGLISEAYLGVAMPNTAAAAAADDGGVVTGAAVEVVGPDNMSAGLAMVARYRWLDVLHGSTTHPTGDV